MSNSLAIAAVTATLRHLIQQGIEANISGVAVTTRPPDKARDNNGSGNQINLFLYHTTPNAAWRNMDMPSQVKLGETGQPPLALNLYYLVTAYSENDDFPDPMSHRLLGGAMSVFHDHPVLSEDDIKAALPLADLPNYDLYDQVERVRITPQSLSLDEISKLWTTFQTQYRISAAYEASVVLIESKRLTKAPLPVLRRGSTDQGISTQPNLTPPYPTLTVVSPPNKQPSARLDEVLTISGSNLNGNNPVVIFRHPRLPDSAPIEVQPEPEGRTATELKVKLPNNELDRWPAGFYTLAVGFKQNDKLERTTNELSFSLAPQIQTITAAPRDANDNVSLMLTCSPQVWLGQRASLILSDRDALLSVSDREILAQAHTVQIDRLEFEVAGVPAGTYFVRPRLRIDGVDSLIVQDYSAKPPVFEDYRELTIP